eukprot:TRINITY_DN8475_c0_g1_i1.p1 TRINITY_DN8475_c0_g1~~TRINITY_DN8475_c0_g1_i1.p1  ORF type:complete len:1182 (+),score=181.52 TRINITY_DN8475_c0_g1_i1:164-3547(+)
MGRPSKQFRFDCVMDSTDPSSKSFCSHEKCYQLMAERMVGFLLGGYSASIFCYGQTGTGKTTTIIGKPKPASEQGILLRFLDDLFKEISVLKDGGSDVECRVQMVEVYNEKLRDLLADDSSSHHPEVHVHPRLGVYLKNVVDEKVETSEACAQLIDEGRHRLSVASTAMNANSSRAHTVFKLSLEKHGGTENTILTSEAFVVDLAGRENERTTKVSGERLVELSFINRSLMWLSQCIHGLGHSSDQAHKRKSSDASDLSARRKSATEATTKRRSSIVSEEAELLEPLSPLEKTKSTPSWKATEGTMARFRNSKLTLLLAKALSGNSKTSVVCTLSPAQTNLEESYTTLNFAAGLKHIRVEVKAVTAVDKDALINGLQSELQKLRDRQTSSGGSTPTEDLGSQLECANGMLEKYRQSWKEKLEENDELRQQRNEALQKLGAARWRMAAKLAAANVSMNPDEECLDLRRGQHDVLHLANYSDDPRLRGQLTAVTREDGRECRMGCDPDCDIVLPSGIGIEPVACHLRSESSEEGGRLFIRPEGGNSSAPALLEVNGERLTTNEPKEIYAGDFVVLGSSLCFFVQAGSENPRDDSQVNSEEQKLSRVQKLPTWWSLNVESRSGVVKQILGAARAAEENHKQMALQYTSMLQGQNLDGSSLAAFNDFLVLAGQASGMVTEANIITKELRPQSGLSVELSAVAPVLALGYGASLSVPDLCFRLVREVKAAEDTGTVVPEVVCLWTLEDFSQRLQAMRELRERWRSAPDSFTLDPRQNPWACQIGQIASDACEKSKPSQVNPEPPSPAPSTSPNPAPSQKLKQARSEQSRVLELDAERLLTKMDTLLDIHRTRAHSMSAEVHPAAAAAAAAPVPSTASAPLQTAVRTLTPTWDNILPASKLPENILLASKPLEGILPSSKPLEAITPPSKPLEGASPSQISPQLQQLMIDDPLNGAAWRNMRHTLPATLRRPCASACTAGAVLGTSVTMATQGYSPRDAVQPDARAYVGSSTCFANSCPLGVDGPFAPASSCTSSVPGLGGGHQGRCSSPSTPTWSMMQSRPPHVPALPIHCVSSKPLAPGTDPLSSARASQLHSRPLPLAQELAPSAECLESREVLQPLPSNSSVEPVGCFE